MTKDEAADLQNLHERVVQCELASANAARELVVAKQHHASFLWNLWNKKTDVGK